MRRREREFDCPVCIAKVGAGCMRYVERKKLFPTSVITGFWVKVNGYHAARTVKVRDAEREEFDAYVRQQKGQTGRK